jgi:hypothetical protein
MLSPSSKQDLLDAYTLLVCPVRKPSIEVLQQLQLSVLKSAYRKKVMETHPDRSKGIGEIESRMNDGFIEVCQAYHKLKSAISNKTMQTINHPTDSPFKKMYPHASVKKNPMAPDHYYKGVFPRRKLLFGQYLYYSKKISWKTLINAIIWQQKQRPPIGQLAIKWGILSSYDIKKILVERIQDKRYKMKFGEYALQKGYISSFEHLALLGKQRRLHRPIGEYFTRKNILRPGELDCLLKGLTSHNKDQ